MNILLVEPAYKTKYPPLGLMKISTYHKQRGDTVQYIKDRKRTQQLELLEPQLSPDVIYITSLFTYYLADVVASARYYKSMYPQADIKVGGIAASLMPDYIYKHTGVIPHIGLLSYAEECAPDYSIPPVTDCSITFTSRGCPRNCSFCAVGLHEKNFYTKDNWIDDIDSSKPKMVFWDNNWLASPNFDKDIELEEARYRNTGRIVQLLGEKGETGQLGQGLHGVRRYVDFSQGLDCRLLTKDKAKQLERIKLYPLRFAYDNPSHANYIQQAIELTRNCVYKAVTCYVLYNTDYDYDSS